MRRGDHLARDAEDHDDARKVEVPRGDPRDDRHDDRGVALAHAREDADHRTHGRDDDRRRKVGRLEGADHFVENPRFREDADEVENAGDVDEELPVQGAHEDVAHRNRTLHQVENRNHQDRHDPHGEASGNVEDEHEDDVDEHRPDRKRNLTDVTAARFGGVLALHAAVGEAKRTDEDEPAREEGDDRHPGEVHDEVAHRNVRDGATENHARNDRAHEFADVAEPEVDRGLALARDRHAAARLVDDRGRKAGAPHGGKKPEEGRHRGERHLGRGEDLVERIDHAAQRSRLAQFDFETHHEVERKEKVVGARLREHLGDGGPQGGDGRIPEGPHHGAARKDGGADGHLEAKDHDHREKAETDDGENAHGVCVFLRNFVQRPKAPEGRFQMMRKVCTFLTVSGEGIRENTERRHRHRRPTLASRGVEPDAKNGFARPGGRANARGCEGNCGLRGFALGARDRVVGEARTDRADEEREVREGGRELEEHRENTARDERRHGLEVPAARVPVASALLVVVEVVHFDVTNLDAVVVDDDHAVDGTDEARENVDRAVDHFGRMEEMPRENRHRKDRGDEAAAAPRDLRGREV